MAQRRMFSIKIVGSDAFLEMSTSSRELYFQLGMYADDDGFVSPKKVMRMIGASDDDLKLLIAKRFVLPFENGIIVVKHWRMNNLIRKDFYKETEYIEQKRRLFLKENGSYTDNSENGTLFLGNGKITASNIDENDCQQNVTKMLPQDRLGKDSIGKNKEYMSATADSQSSNKEFDEFWDKYPRREQKKKSLDIWKRKQFGNQLDKILSFIEKAKQTDRWKKGFIKQPPAFLNGECWNDDLTSYADLGNQSINTILDLTK